MSLLPTQLCWQPRMLPRGARNWASLPCTSSCVLLVEIGMLEGLGSALPEDVSGLGSVPDCITSLLCTASVRKVDAPCELGFKLDLKDVCHLVW